jgi:murein DD-endopeptidase MepM/ murein hydrolase activator NlpD
MHEKHRAQHLLRSCYDKQTGIVKFIYSVILCFICLAGRAQNNIKIFDVKENDRTILYAQNNEYAPVSIVLSLVLQNFNALDYTNGVYVIPARTEKFRLLDLTKMQPGRASYSYNYKAVFGNVNQTEYNGAFLYDLPYRRGERYRIEQGYHGRLTHQNENALDFNMPEGSQIRAARGGVVIAVVQNFTGSCLEEECKKMANYVLVYHSDGTISDYSHIQYNGASVAVGDTVKKGDPIALSGRTGYTRGPHLHFVTFLPDFESRRTLTTKFRTGEGKTSAYLAGGRTYTKSY